MGKAKKITAFDAEVFLETPGLSRNVVEYRRGEVIFSAGDACDHVMYILKGGVKVSVRSKTGREFVVAELGPSDFFGESALAGQPVRTETAKALTPATILLIGKRKMVRLLHTQRVMSDRFIVNMLARNICVVEDLIDQLFKSGQKRMARVLPRRTRG